MAYGDPIPVRKVALGVAAGLLLSIFLTFGFLAGLKAFSRYQKLQDAKNRVRVSAIEIRNQEQRVLVAQQQAEIRHEEAKGVRLAQDEINRTLTPLYVQHEMVQALKDIAASGSNNSVVYIPAGANGVPLVATTNPDQVTQADR